MENEKREFYQMEKCDHFMEEKQNRKERNERKEKEREERKERKEKEEKNEKKERKEKGKSSRRIWNCTARGKEPLLLWLTSFLRVVLRQDLRPCVDCFMGILYTTTCFKNLGGHNQNLVICLICVGDPNRRGNFWVTHL